MPSGNIKEVIASKPAQYDQRFRTKCQRHNGELLRSVPVDTEDSITQKNTDINSKTVV